MIPEEAAPKTEAKSSIEKLLQHQVQSSPVSVPNTSNK